MDYTRFLLTEVFGHFKVYFPLVLDQVIYFTLDRQSSITFYYFAESND